MTAFFEWYYRVAAHPLYGNILSVLKLIAAYFILRFALNNIVGRLIVPLMAGPLEARSSARAARVKTLAGVVRSTANYVLTFVMVVMALKAFNVDTAPILASAGVVGLAVGFGSQRLVRDVTTGFFLLAENQFDVGDYVTIGTATGTVEEIGMRTTRIRDDSGKLYILSNGDISLVCNLSEGLMSVNLDVAVPAGVDLEKVRVTVEKIGQVLEEDFGEQLLERPRVEGLTALTGSQMTVRIRYRAVAAFQERTQMRLRELIREHFAAEGIPLA
ncbi:MAG: mechanosensitive ion channel family protein [Armatimonadota bacterium]|nr:mechanosensitive ion channel family protein [Armatimonadota bacterium]